MYSLIKAILSISLVVIISLTASLAQIPSGLQNSPRIKLSLNQEGKFQFGKPEVENFKPDTDYSKWQSVHLPHTLELTDLNLNGYQDNKTQQAFQKNVGWYRKNITIDQANKKVFLEFDGAHQVTHLWIKGVHLGKHSMGGYTPLHFDNTDSVQKGIQNQIALLVDNRHREDVPLATREYGLMHLKLSNA